MDNGENGFTKKIGSLASGSGRGGGGKRMLLVDFGGNFLLEDFLSNDFPARRGSICICRLLFQPPFLPVSPKRMYVPPLRKKLAAASQPQAFSSVESIQGPDFS